MTNLTEHDKAFIRASVARAHREYVAPLNEQGLDGFSLHSVTHSISKGLHRASHTLSKLSRKVGLQSFAKTVASPIKKLSIANLFGKHSLINLATKYAAKEAIPIAKLTPFYWATKAAAPKSTKKLEGQVKQISKKIVTATQHPGTTVIKTVKAVEAVAKNPKKAANDLVKMTGDIATQAVSAAKEAAPKALAAAAIYYGGPAAAGKVAKLYGQYQQGTLTPQSALNVLGAQGQGSLSNMPVDALVQTPEVQQAAGQLMSQNYADNYGMDMQSPEAQNMIASNVAQAADTAQKKSKAGWLALGIPAAYLLLH